MKEWTEARLKWYLENLATNDIEKISQALFIVAQMKGLDHAEPVPTDNTRVIAYLERLVEDRSGCIIIWRIPYVYGEIRWLAARLLACEYAYRGIEKPIILKDVIQPIESYGETYSLNALNRNIVQGLLPTTTEIIRPQDYCEWCSKEAIEKRQRKQESEE